MQNKTLVYIFSIIIILLIFSNCSNTTKRSEKYEGAVLIWHWMTDRHKVFKQLENKYFQETGKKVVFELNAPSNLYSAKVIGAAQTNKLPDIFGVLGGKQELANYINSGLIHPLSNVLNTDNSKWKKDFFNNALNMTAFLKNNPWDVTPGYYGVPIDVANIQMIYNKDIFENAGIKKIPVTWDEFIKAGEIIKRKTNKEFFLAGFGETWIILSIIRNIAYNMLGEEKFLQTIKGEFSYNSEEWIAVFTKIKEMVDKGLFGTGIVTMINKKVERLFVTGRAAVTYNGAWCVNVFKGMNPELNYGTMFFPTINKLNPTVIQGGAGSSFLISSKSKMIPESISFLKWLTSKDVQSFLFHKTSNLPSNINAIEKKPSIYNQFVDDMDKIIHPSTMPCLENPKIEETLAKEIQLLIMKSKGISPESIAKKIALLKNKQVNS